VATKRTKKSAGSGDDVGAAATTPAPRLRGALNTIDRVRGELARLYREGKAGTRDVNDVSKLANVLAILGRLIEGAELEARIDRLEKSAAKDTPCHRSTRH
jgi:hypothetical protein